MENYSHLIGKYFIFCNRRHPTKLPTVAKVVAVNKIEIIYKANNKDWKIRDLILSKPIDTFLEQAIPVSEAAEVLYF